MPAPRLTTERLVLRGFGDADRDPFAALNADRRVMEHFPRTLARRESDAFIDRILERWESDGIGLWAVERAVDGRFLGFTGLVLERGMPFSPAVEVGWRYAAEAWGRGYATEAARAAVGFGFRERALPEILSWTVPQNLASRRVMDRIGMLHDPADDFDHPRHLENDRIRHHVLYRLTRERWSSFSVATAHPGS